LARRISSKDAPSATPSSFNAPSTVISNGAGEESSAREADRRGGLHRERGNAQHRPEAKAACPRSRGVPPPPPLRERAVAVAIISPRLRSLGASSLACVCPVALRVGFCRRMIFFFFSRLPPDGIILGLFWQEVWISFPSSKTGHHFILL
jgi:hypothetical protein